MLVFLLKRLGVMLLTALCLTLIVFMLVNLKPNLVKLAKEQTGSRITDQQVEVWLDQNGYNRPLFVRYSEWLGGVAKGEIVGYIAARMERSFAAANRIVAALDRAALAGGKGVTRKLAAEVLGEFVDAAQGELWDDPPSA